eukprot:scaffold1141_cov128-Isochrysis_galbana.AAC.13
MRILLAGLRCRQAVEEGGVSSYSGLLVVVVLAGCCLVQLRGDEVCRGGVPPGMHAAAWHHPSAKAPESRMNKETGTGQLGLGEGA